MFSHKCLKCKMGYQDSDPDEYLCPKCIEAKKAIAAQIDAQFASRPHVTPTSALQEHERNGKTIEIDGRKVTFARA